MDKQEKLNDQLFQAAKSGDLATLEQALADGADAKARDSRALDWAARGGRDDCVKMLIGVSDPLAGGSSALNSAARDGHAGCVKLLIPVSDPLAEDSYALKMAAEGGYAQCVKLLIPVSDPKSMDSYALRVAAHKGHRDCVALLLPASDPLAGGSAGMDAAGLARTRGHVEVAGMIEAFMEATALVECAQNAKMNPRAKSAL
jgi:ankyrin repeat protein